MGARFTTRTPFQAFDNEQTPSKVIETGQTPSKAYWNNHVLRWVLLGTGETSTSPLRVLRGQRDVLRQIFRMLFDSWEWHLDRAAWGFYELVDWELNGKLRFPKPTGIQVNMMPFVYGEKDSLPKKYHRYWELILACSEPRRTVCYLTIDERRLEKGESHRPPGLHTETIGSIRQGSPSIALGNTYLRRRSYFSFGHKRGGLYIASNVADSCRVWDCQIRSPAHVVGNNGDVEFLRPFLPNEDGHLMQANTLYWLADCTPRESLPLQRAQYHQFFRLVSSNVSGWFAKHSTPNPLGVHPGCEILTFDKLEDGTRAVGATEQNA